MNGKRRRGDRGSVAISLAVLFPAIILGMVAAIQMAMWGHYRQVAAAAAQDAATEFAQAGGAGGEGQVRAMLSAYGAGDLDVDVIVSTAPSGGAPETVTVRLVGSAPAMADLWSLPIDVVATAGVERFRP